jgi:DNA anti-recombination protein RmuC
LADSAQRERIVETEKNYKKSSKLTSEPEVIVKTRTQTTKGSYKGNYALTETIDNFKTRVGYQDNMDKNEFETWKKTHGEDYQKIRNWEKEIQEAHDKWMQENAEQIKTNETNYSNYIQDLQD